MALRRPIAHHLLRAGFRFALSIYYRNERSGPGAVPSEGPVLLVSNHPNGLVDPIVLASTTDRTVRFLGKAPLFEMPLVGSIMRGFRALPVYRTQDGADTAQNQKTFEAVWDALAAGDLVCLFPEGKSHDEPTLQKLKTGTARMALGAEAKADFKLGVRIVPVGLMYRAKRRFRSRVATCVGEPIDAREFAPAYAEDEREAARALTSRIAAGLDQVTLTLDRWEDLPLLELAAQVFEPSQAKRLEDLHEFSDGVSRLRASHDPLTHARLDDLTDRVAAFRDRLRALGLGLENVHATYRPGAVLRFVLRTLGAMLVLLPLALLGALFWFVPYYLVTFVPRWAKPSRDVYASVKILAGSVLFPLWWLAAASLVWFFGLPAFLGLPALSPGWASALVLGCAPPAGLLALAYRDWRTEVFEDVRAFFLLGQRKRLRALLVREREEISAEIGTLRSELPFD